MGQGVTAATAGDDPAHSPIGDGDVANRHLFFDLRTGIDGAIEQPAIEHAARDGAAHHSSAIFPADAHPAGPAQHHAEDRIALGHERCQIGMPLEDGERSRIERVAAQLGPRKPGAIEDANA